jgi:chorismate mutase/prephenate dehydrogenase
MDTRLAELRDEIGRLDRELVDLAARRVALAREAGDLKRQMRLSIVDYAQERVVLDRAREAASRSGLDPAVAEALLATLIRTSVSAQDRDSVKRASVGAGKRAIVVGGEGRMGRWFVRFLTDQGYTVGSLDPLASEEEQAWAREGLAGADLVVSAAPPVATASVYDSWVSSPPSGVIVDIASIKTPLMDSIGRLQKAGARVASIHPMFGPSVVLLRECDVVICDTGDAAAEAEVARLFEPTTARVLRMPLAEHDRLMADVLTLAHATAIAFALALPAESSPVRSTTLGALERLSANVVRESPDVYFEIQARNPHSGRAIARLADAIARVGEVVAAADADRFRSLMEEGKRRCHE